MKDNLKVFCSAFLGVIAAVLLMGAASNTPLRDLVKAIQSDKINFTPDGKINLEAPYYLGVNPFVDTVTSKATIITGGGSQFAAAENGTPLHITYKKVGAAYVQVIAEATDAELAEHGIGRDKFKGRP